MEARKEYSNGELTVVWKPRLCIHSANCVKGSPGVFKPKEKPWIQMDGGNTEELKNTIDKCPSGALSYYMNADGKPSEATVVSSEGTKVEVLANGPLMVTGPVEITHDDGRTESKTRNTAFCRCGKTANIPFCDGSHKA